MVRPIVMPAGIAKSVLGISAAVLRDGDAATSSRLMSGMHIITSDMPKNIQRNRYKTASIIKPLYIE